MLKLIFLMFILAAIVFFVFIFTIFGIVKKAKSVSRLELAGRKCPACGQVLGDSVARDAERNYLKKAAEHWQENSGMRYRLTAIWPVKCNRCDWKGTFEPAKNELMAEGVVIG